MSDFKTKMHQIRFPLGSLQRSPSPLAVFKGPIYTYKGREEKGRGRKGGNRNVVHEISRIDDYIYISEDTFKVTWMKS